MAEKELERIYVIPLQKIKHYTSASRLAPRAIKEIKRFLVRHMKVEENDIWIDNSVNENIWSRSKYKIPNRVRVRAIKFDDGVVEVSLPELELKESRREEIKAVKETKKPILKKEEEKPAEEGEEEKEKEIKEEEKTEDKGKGETKEEKKKEEEIAVEEEKRDKQESESKIEKVKEKNKEKSVEQKDKTKAD
ncbi:MAG: 50S ribosomal protein L31e [Thermoplasmata archaeon]|nr:50S ribosomal protein L31e [Thermoplasmata archaeon]